jgi:ligand-binding SRPBCC domain-containing protein
MNLRGLKTRATRECFLDPQSLPMPTLHFETTVAAPLQRVWEFHQDVRVSLPALSPQEDSVVLESADTPPLVGARIVITARGPMGRRIRWVALIVEHSPPHGALFGEEARFVDEQEAGPFARWRHAHEFERIDENTTRVVDHIEYRPPLGPLGWIADKIFVARKLKRMFAERHATLKRLLDSAG